MFGGNSGSSGIVVYDTKKEEPNAVYGYYKGREMCFEIGTKEEMTALRKSRDGTEGRKKDKPALKRLGIFLLIYILAVIVSFALFPLRVGFAVLVFCLLSYMPMLVIATANSKLYDSDEELQAFRRNHGCEHTVIQALTKEKDCTVETLRKMTIYDTECGTAYSGYTVFLSLMLALLIVFWPGLLKTLGLLILAVILLLVMIVVPAINPFRFIQRPVVTTPGDKEYELGAEIMKRVKEL